MYTKPKTQLRFIFGSILVLTLALAACNSGESDKTVVKDTMTSTEVKTTVPPPAVKDTMDTIPGNQAPTPGGGGN
jgi:hypothetical protein